MDASLFKFESILQNCYEHQGNTIICSSVCLVFVILLVAFTSKRKHLLVYLPLLNRLPIYIWGVYGIWNLIGFECWLLDNLHPPLSINFPLWAIYQYIPLVLVLLFSGVSSLIIDKSKNYKELNLPHSALLSFIPAIVIGTVSCNWMFVWYLAEPKGYF